MGNSTFLRDIVLRHTLLDPKVFRTLYISLHVGNPGDTGAAELSGGEYSRRQITAGRSAPGVAVNQNILEFPKLPASSVSHFGVWDSERGGEFLTGGSLVQPAQMLEGQTLRWQESELVLRVG